MNLEYAFYVECMTSLRYAIPFIKTSKKILGVNIILLYDESYKSRKYNSINTLLKNFKRIVEENEIETIDVSKVTPSINTLFCVENVNKFKSKKVYAFQHGFDYKDWAKKNNQAIYLTTDSSYVDDLEKIGVNSIVQPTPVVFWDWDNNTRMLEKLNPSKDKSATLFYPEYGNHEIFEKIENHIKSLGYKTYIKQRTKNQPIPTKYENIFYDNVWYPSESIFLPIISDFSVGFGTSAYTDLIHIDRQFVDLSIPEYSKKYLKFNKNNFVTISENFYDNFCKVNLGHITLEEKLHNPNDYDKIRLFLEKILL